MCERHFDRAQAVRLEQAVHLVVRRRRQHHRVALRAERAQHEVEALLRARGDEDVVGARRRIVAARAFADLLAQFAHASRRVRVAEHLGAARVQHAIHRRAQRIDREARAVRRQLREVCDQRAPRRQRRRARHLLLLQQGRLGERAERTVRRSGVLRREHRRAATYLAGDEARVRQLAIGVRDHRARHPRGLRDLADRRQPVARAQLPAADRRSVERGDLVGERRVGAAVEGRGGEPEHQGRRDVADKVALSIRTICLRPFAARGRAGACLGQTAIPRAAAGTRPRAATPPARRCGWGCRRRVGGS